MLREPPPGDPLPSATVGWYSSSSHLLPRPGCTWEGTGNSRAASHLANTYWVLRMCQELVSALSLQSSVTLCKELPLFMEETWLWQVVREVWKRYYRGVEKKSSVLPRRGVRKEWETWVTNQSWWIGVFWVRLKASLCSWPTSFQFLVFENSSILFFLIYYFIYLFLAALGLRCWTQAFSSGGERGLLFVAVRGLLIVVASPVVEHGL